MHHLQIAIAHPQCKLECARIKRRAAVAARTCFGAIGTDTGCSVRLPAAWCGIAGIRPTIGRVSNYGITPL
ncbi:MAG: amidase family protein, partial [Martelella sp.]